MKLPTERLPPAGWARPPHTAARRDCLPRVSQAEGGKKEKEKTPAAISLLQSTTTNKTTLTPMARFEIQPGKKYRFRVINAGSLSCPIQLQFEGHEMSVIAADGLDIKPQKANSLITFSGALAISVR